MPGAISIVTSFSTMCTLTTSPGVSGGSAAGYGVCAFASSAAFSGAAPAKLCPSWSRSPAAVMSSIEDTVVPVRHALPPLERSTPGQDAGSEDEPLPRRGSHRRASPFS